MNVSDVTKGIAMLVDFISKLSGNLETTDLSKYEKVSEVFGTSVVKKETNTFKPQAGMGFKIR